jgi:hypothetical protein
MSPNGRNRISAVLDNLKGVLKMSRKHFLVIATCLRINKANYELCEMLAYQFKAFNSNFDINRFLTACGH